MAYLSARTLLDRATLWARGHVLAVDAGWALLWFALSVVSHPVPGFRTAESWAHLALAAACCTALALRRTRPLPALAALAALLSCQILWLDHLTAVTAISALVAAYTAQAELPRTWRAAGFGLLLAGAAWAVLSIPPEELSADPEPRLNSVLSAWTAVALFSLLGTFRRRNREEFARVVEHARLLETQREQEVRLAALDERTRIAREMHDVLAHSLNVIVAQADGGRYAAHADPERAVGALATIAQVGRESAAELHQLLGVLRDGEDRGSAPAPGVGDLLGLVEEYRRAGLRIRLVQHGSPPAPRDGRTGPGTPSTLPATASLTVYRVVQESLANALKHAGAAAVRVELTWSPGRVEVVVANAVREAVPAVSGASASPPVFPSPSTVEAPPDSGRRGPGHGLVGMRERVGLHGGTLEVGADGATGTWRVRAVVPWEDA
ncbi:histidine kinase [Nocardiopsis sp. TSRI0078]|uniref:sensor histidine kinase n=1 Tax=unclassified Nocardiopsis TaxID=2649073 RepID=UPI00093CEBFD|nr:histidine kinase [Nocardiopsis sp. TSRI0078]OKI21919.1 histidine kinase [Nocardiopsis sp. TSRI0078]